MTQISVKLLKERSEEAFEQVVREYGRRLYYVALRLLRRPAEAEDAVQETFLKAFRAIDTFHENSSLFTWLYRIVCNESLMRLRKRSRDRTVAIEDYLPAFDRGEHVEAVGDWVHAPDVVARSRELQEFYERCIDELPDDYRLAYILKDLEKLSEDEVCAVLELTKPTMKNRVHRARLVIRRRIDQRYGLGDTS